MKWPFLYTFLACVYLLPMSSMSASNEAMCLKCRTYLATCKTGSFASGCVYCRKLVTQCEPVEPPQKSGVLLTTPDGKERRCPNTDKVIVYRMDGEWWVTLECK